MPLPLALPLAPALGPLLGPSAAAAATLSVGVAVQVAQGAFPFRGSLPGTGTAGRNLGELENLIRDALAGARLPVAFPEPPKLPPLGPGPAAALGAAAAGLVSQASGALSQLWGWLNSVMGSGGPAPWPLSEASVTDLPEVADYLVTFSVTTTAQFYSCESGALLSGGTSTGTAQVAMTGASGFGLRPGASVSFSTQCDEGFSTFVDDARALIRDSGGSVAEALIGGGVALGHGPDQRLVFVRSVGVASVTRDGQVVPSPAGYLDGLRVPFPSAFVEPEPEKKPAPPLAPPRPEILPQVPTGPEVPAIPGQPAPGTPAPQPPGTPAPAENDPVPWDPNKWEPWDQAGIPMPKPPGWPGPTVTPSRVPAPGPLIVPQIPGAQPTTPGGLVQTQPQPGPTTTRPGTEVIAGNVIPNRPPAPTLTGIAAEVGRIEQKLALQLRQPGPAAEALGPLLQRILDLLEAAGDTGTYEIGGPCERDAEGEPIEFEDSKVAVEWGGETSAVANLASRIDALAELIQLHKLLRQPTCLKTPAIGGEWVTVNFEQVTS